MPDEKPLSLADEPTVSQELLSDAERRELETKHGEIVAVQTPCGVAAFRSYTRGEYQKYNSFLFDEKKRHLAFEALVAGCVVKPDGKTFQTWLDRKPGITQMCLKPVLELGGAEDDAQTKKYSTT